jgi:glucosamine-6-phosphate deaminase
MKMGENIRQVRRFKKELLDIFIYPNRAQMGAAAGKAAVDRIKEIIRAKGEANLIFAAAPSQNEILDALLQSDIDFGRVRGFQQDEYIGLDGSHPAVFRNYLQEHIFGRAPFKEVYYMGVPKTLKEAEKRCEEYKALLEKYPPDLIFLGIGENGHLAFNDPPVADFNDPKAIKIVELDEACRIQQVNDGCFKSLKEVPTHAITLTMSFIMSVPEAIVTVPSERKAEAVNNALNEPVDISCPASILRRHKNAALYLDFGSAGKIIRDVAI